MRRVVACVGVAATLLAGCGGGSESSDDAATTATSAVPSATPTPVPVRTVEQLAAALPTKAQVPTANRTTSTCPGDDSCRPDVASVSMRLQRPGSAEERRRLADVEFLKDFVQVDATAAADDAAAQALVARSREVAQRYDGPFDRAAKETSDTTYTPAEKGSGTTDDLTVEGWDGFENVRDQTFADPEGEGSEKRYGVAQVHLASGNSVLSVYVTVMSEPRGRDGARDLARRLATEYVARLG